MATALEAGISVVSALERFQGPKRQWRQEMAEALKEGRALEDVFRETAWLPPSDRPALAVGAKAGRLPDTMRLLSRKQEMLARQGGRVRAATIYPLLVTHFAAFIIPVQELIMGDPWVYAGLVAMILVPLWIVIIGLRLILRQPRLRGWILRCFPLWRKFWKNQVMADFCFTLEAELVAGENVIQAWRDAGETAENPALARAARRVADTVERDGRTPGAVIEDFRVFSGDFVHFYQGGEISGKLTENLDYLSESFRDNAAGALATAAVVYSTLPIIILALGVAAYVISFWLDYFGQFEELFDY